MDNDRSDLVRQGEEALEKRNWKEAIYFFGQASLIKNTFDINKKIVASLLKIGKFDDAVDQASIYYGRYLENDVDAKFLFQILMDANEFLMTYQFLEIVKEDEYTILSDDEISRISDQLEECERAFISDHQKDIENQEKELMSLVTMQAGIQASKIRNMKYLPINNFLDVSQNLLLNPYLHPLFKNEIIENLVKLKLNKQYTISFFGEIREFNPFKLKTLLFSPEYTNAREIMSKKLANYDDYEANLMINEFLLYISMSYPFIGEIIDDIDFWIDIYLKRYNQDYIEPTKKNEKIVMWLDRYSKLLETFEN
ncbi:hypothetical protein RD055328_07310 [Companilactobacillus sp. RD055328]|uniref:hypothetical protein n=1 Tax=Companilactobacillus sp. RD055328 TaxID=2916634 RepID=UPI001FC87157|nr:hypothetical protein [Companilactobacillus sp. RD055328]GKQ42808.1 hypothetical protein RD055328_07310 [Companilactobacillus sp. RD055328]